MRWSAASAVLLRGRRWERRIGAASLAAIALAVSAAPPAARASFQFGLQDAGIAALPGSPAMARAYATLRKVGGTTVRIILPWGQIAPSGKTKPAGFNAANPADPYYSSWSSTVDAWVKAAVAHHAQVIINVTGAPRWAQGSNPPSGVACVGAWDVNAPDLGNFMYAAAVRYSGHFPDPAVPGTFLPHVSYWEIWNEENLPETLMAPNRVADYRAMLNDSYASIKRVDPSALVLIGGLAPVSFIVPPTTLPPSCRTQSPLELGARLLCLHRAGTGYLRNRSCPDRARFDAFAIHPYTVAATPTKHAYRYDDVLVADIGKVRALIRAADRLHTAGGSRRHGIWVTEWSWITNPPDKRVGDSWPTAARYVAWSLYEMWRDGVSRVVWFSVRDPAQVNPQLFVFGGGLFTADGRPKPTLQAFAFPFVAGVFAGRGFAWGRVPLLRRLRVTVQRRAGRGWVHVVTARTAPDGTFLARFAAHGNGIYRALVPGGPASLAYSSAPIPARRTHAFSSG